MRVLGIDPGTVSIDLCGLANGRVVIDTSTPSTVALADPAAFVAEIVRQGPFDCIVGPSGYGLPMVRGAELTDETIRLALLAPPGRGGGIGGLGALLRALATSSLPTVFTPGAVHLPTIPTHRKINRVDMGTADKVCVCALAIDDQARRRRRSIAETSFILLELGGAFTAALAVDGGRIIDGIGGSAGPLGVRASGAIDAEVAYLAGCVTKSMVFEGGAASVRGELADLDALAQPASPRERVAWDAYLESALKAVAALRVTLPDPAEIIVSGRMTRSAPLMAAFVTRLRGWAPTVALHGFANIAKQAAQGAALIADGLSGGPQAGLVDAMGLRDAAGSALDYLYVISAARARETIAGNSDTWPDRPS